MALDIFLDPNYPNFKEHGNPICSTTDPEIFFPEKGNRDNSHYAASAARQMCAGCPYKTPCLAWAVERNEIGIWGGTTAKERRVYRKRLKSKSE